MLAARDVGKKKRKKRKAEFVHARYQDSLAYMQMQGKRHKHEGSQRRMPAGGKTVDLVFSPEVQIDEFKLFEVSEALVSCYPVFCFVALAFRAHSSFVCCLPPTAE